MVLKKYSIRKNIQLKNVHFAYPNKQSVLNDVDLKLKLGKCTALYGKNGAGKSTIIHLLLGFYAPIKGQVLVDDIPMKNLEIQHLRRQMGIVSQKPLLFQGSIYENISYGFSSASLSLVKKAAQLAGIAAFIESLPEKYNTPIGDNGILFSGGQQQRIALARAILPEPPILILDEPTNHLDIDSIEFFLKQFKNLSFRPAILIISHHKLVLELADEIYFLQQGKIKRIRPHLNEENNQHQLIKAL